MKVWELVELLNECDERWDVEVMFNLHSNKRVLIPDKIKIIEDRETDEEGNYEWVCILNLWDFA
jgi:hypothetical protein